MGPAAGVLDLAVRGECDLDVARIGICLQIASKALQEFFGAFARVAGREVVADIRMLVVADIGPEVRRACAVQLLIPHWYGGIIGAQHLRSECPADDELIQPTGQPGAGGHPITLRAAGDVDPVTTVTSSRRLSQMFGQLGGRDERQHPRRGQPLFDRLRRLRRRHHVGRAIFVLAGVDITHMLLDVERRRLEFQLLINLLADFHSQLPTAGYVALLRSTHKRSAGGARNLATGGGRDHDVVLKVLANPRLPLPAMVDRTGITHREQLLLSGVFDESFASLAEQITLKKFQPVTQLVDLAVLLVDRRLLRLDDARQAARSSGTEGAAGMIRRTTGVSRNVTTRTL